MKMYESDLIEERLLQLYRDAKVVVEGHFLLTSGRHGHTYINKDAIYKNPQAFRATVDALAARVGVFYHCDIITGPAIAGAVLAAPVALAMDKVFIYPEKVMVLQGEDPIEEVMVFRRGYDKIIPEQSVLIVEDIITTGGSVKKTADAISDLRGSIAGVLVIWNRSGWKPGNCNIVSLINQKVDSWEEKDCPYCHDPKQMLPLQDPKSL